MNRLYFVSEFIHSWYFEDYDNVRKPIDFESALICAHKLYDAIEKSMTMTVKEPDNG